MNFTRENARESTRDLLIPCRRLFGDKIIGEVCAAPTAADKDNFVAVCGLPFAAPVAAYLLVDGTMQNYIASFKETSHLFVAGETPRHFTESGEVKMESETAKRFSQICETVLQSPGFIGPEGEHVINLKGNKIGTHFDVNLLIGNRIGFPDPMLTTPKGALDSLGRGCFRAGASKQVTSTRYNLIPEQNGEPCNRQFYLVENGRQIFYSADVHTNVKTAECRHFSNYTVITYETDCGLSVTRTLFILPHAEGMPEATEVQTVSIENRTGRDRDIKIVFTGMLGLASPESAMNDSIYASVTWQSSIVKLDGKCAAVCPTPHPGYLRPNKRFALLITDGGEFFDGYTANYMDFIGNGTLEAPQNVASLASVPVMKMVPFYAIDKKMTVPAGSSRTVSSYTGIVTAKGGDDAVFYDALGVLISSYRRPGAAEEALEKVKKFGREYAGFLSVKTGNEAFDTYVNKSLPFQVYYQSYVSRSFAWTQKAYREIGFREIQDMYASLYYIIGMDNGTLAREMLGAWVKNVYEMGYANHNFYEVGKQPGVCSDDGLWLSQAVFRYVSLTGDTAFLSEEFPIAGSEKTRTVLETLLATVTYSGSVSVGAHGLPLLDKADWNDCLKLDDDWIDGPTKEKLYLEQLEKSGKPYGTPLESEYSESVMNAFLLKIAYDDIAALCEMTGDTAHAEQMKTACEALCERIKAHCWKGDFFARALIGGKRPGGQTFLGAGHDGLSADPAIDGTYYLNSFSWSILSGVATEEQIGTMLKKIKEVLVTPAGVKLCTNADLSRLSNGNASGSYFPGDRENGGVFKHAAMMAASASLGASKRVKDGKLAEALADFAYYALETTLPYKTLEHPYRTKGNPRFCTQYNNSVTGENIGPMLSGTASWLNLTLMELLGLTYSGENLVFSPILPRELTHAEYTVCNAGTRYTVVIDKPKGFARVSDGAKMTLDGVPFDGVTPRASDRKEHRVTIRL